MTMVELAFLLSRGPETERPVIDRTGLEGDYVIELQYARHHSPGALVSTAQRAREDSATPPQSFGPSLFEAVQTQLGLKVKSTKGPVEFIVIDHIEMPAEN